MPKGKRPSRRQVATSRSTRPSTQAVTRATRASASDQVPHRSSNTSQNDGATQDLQAVDPLAGIDQALPVLLEMVRERMEQRNNIQVTSPTAVSGIQGYRVHTKGVSYVCTGCMLGGLPYGHRLMHSVDRTPHSMSDTGVLTLGLGPWLNGVRVPPLVLGVCCVLGFCVCGLI